MNIGANQDGAILLTTGTVASSVTEVVTLTASDTLVEGTFKLTFGGVETAALAYTATAAQIQAALVAHAQIGAGGVVCTGGPVTDPLTPVVITWAGIHAGKDMGAITVTSAASLNGKTIGVSTSAGVTGTYRGFPGNNPILLKTDTGIAYYRTGHPNVPQWTAMEFTAVSAIN